MSGGVYNYSYKHVDDMAECLRNQHKDPLRRAFAEHLRLVAKAMHAFEWIDSCDWSEGEGREVIRACLSSGAELAAAVEMAKEAESMLVAAIVEAQRAQLAGRVKP